MSTLVYEFNLKEPSVSAPGPAAAAVSCVDIVVVSPRDSVMFH